MALLVILAGVLNREYQIKRALLLAGFAMVTYNPKVLAFDPSFQLSFLATIGLIYFSPWFEKRIHWIPERFGLREIVSATFATQAIVLPRLLSLSGTFSVLGVFANILVLPFIPLTMLFGSLAGFAAFVHELVSLPFAYLSYLLLHYEIFVAKFFASIPFAVISIPQLPTWIVAGMYLSLTFLLYQLARKKKHADQVPILATPGLVKEKVSFDKLAGGG